MATESQAKANRKNALKSTGPRTAEGKEVAAQNALKHGLRTKRNVIKTENQDEFDIFRDEIIAGISPDGAMEEMLAERIVSLSWRLKRAEHFQNAVIDALIEHGLHGASGGFGWTSENRERATKEAAAGDVDVMLGIVINHDFANSKTLDMLLSYERRIESSLYRAIAELKKVKHTRLEQEDDMARASVRLVRPCSRQVNSPKSSPCMHGQACPEQSRRDAHATFAGTNEANFEEELSESHPYPDKGEPAATGASTAGQDDFGLSIASLRQAQGPSLSRTKSSDQLSRAEDATLAEEDTAQDAEDIIFQASPKNCDDPNEANLHAQ